MSEQKPAILAQAFKLVAVLAIGIWLIFVGQYAKLHWFFNKPDVLTSFDIFLIVVTIALTIAGYFLVKNMFKKSNQNDS